MLEEIGAHIPMVVEWLVALVLVQQELLETLDVAAAVQAGVQIIMAEQVDSQGAEAEAQATLVQLMAVELEDMGR